jgi:Flp pilus assembly pilin Flp
VIRRRLVRDERGTTLAELVVGMATGSVVLLGLTTLIVVTLHTSTRVSARVDATQRARLALTRVIDQLHSACIAPKTPPIRQGSTSTVLSFVHATGAAVSPTPTLTVISLSGETLSQADYAWKEGTAPFWVFKTTPTTNVQLVTKIKPISASRPVFSYFPSASGAVSPTPLAVPLSELDAARTIHVSVAFMASPGSGATTEDATPARIQGSATLRLTAPSFNKEAPSLPCQ